MESPSPHLSCWVVEGQPVLTTIHPVPLRVGLTVPYTRTRADILPEIYRLSLPSSLSMGRYLPSGFGGGVPLSTSKGQGLYCPWFDLDGDKDCHVSGGRRRLSQGNPGFRSPDPPPYLRPLVVPTGSLLSRLRRLRVWTTSDRHTDPLNEMRGFGQKNEF